MLLNPVELPRKLISSRYRGSLDGVLPSNFGALDVPQRGIWNYWAIAGGGICTWLVGGGIGMLRMLRMEVGNRMGTQSSEADEEDDSDGVNKGKSGLVLDMSRKKVGSKRNDRDSDGVRLDRMGDSGEEF